MCLGVHAEPDIGAQKRFINGGYRARAWLLMCCSNGGLELAVDEFQSRHQNGFWLSRLGPSVQCSAWAGTLTRESTGSLRNTAYLHGALL